MLYLDAFEILSTEARCTLCGITLKNKIHILRWHLTSTRHIREAHCHQRLLPNQSSQSVRRGTPTPSDAPTVPASEGSDFQSANSNPEAFSFVHAQNSYTEEKYYGHVSEWSYTERELIERTFDRIADEVEVAQVVDVFDDAGSSTGGSTQDVSSDTDSEFDFDSTDSDAENDFPCDLGGSADYAPFSSKGVALCAFLLTLPRHPISEGLAKLIWWWARQLGATLPSYKSVKNEIEKIKCTISMHTHQRTTASGDVLFVNDINDIIKQELANPRVMQHLRLFPEDTGNAVAELYQFTRWKTDPHFAAPMISQGIFSYYVGELAWCQSGGGDVDLLLIEGFCVRQGYLHVKGKFVVEVDNGYWISNDEGLFRTECLLEPGPDTSEVRGRYEIDCESSIRRRIHYNREYALAISDRARFL
ncbi:hypothetical protein BC832DRAFT_590694 [Gaertneriomyces semiglobifer]|nr:hypothetical protein BC832DRAFT_590694 [Gaertneriomyces semiglobifer]